MIQQSEVTAAIAYLGKLTFIDEILHSGLDWTYYFNGLVFI